MPTPGFHENGKVAPRNSTLNPGDEIKIRRFVAVEISDALGVVAAKLGKTGRLKLNLTGTDKKPVSTASVDFRLEELDRPVTRMRMGKSKSSCRRLVEDVLLDIGRETQELPLEIKDGQTVEKSISMNDQSGIRFSVKKEDGSTTPCKVQFIGLGRNAEPQTRSGDRAHGCKDQYHSEKGEFSVALDRASTG